jgi:acyl-CoA reductase-like NAD-dependent aldehyde dehydrogenase
MSRVRAAVTSVVNPATEQVTAEVPRTSLEEVDRAIEAANRAFESWRQVAPADRGRLLSRFADAVDADRQELAQLEMRDSSYTIGNAREEAGNVRDVLNCYSAAPKVVRTADPGADALWRI